MAHALNMLGRGTVSVFCGDGESLNRFLSRQAQLLFAAFEPLERLLERHRPGSDDVFEILPMQAIFNFKPAAAERVGDIDQHFVGLERLDDVSKRAHIQRGIRQHRAIETGHHDDGGVGMLTQDIADEIHAGFTGHIHIA